MVKISIWKMALRSPGTAGTGPCFTRPFAPTAPVHLHLYTPSPPHTSPHQSTPWSQRNLFHILMHEQRSEICSKSWKLGQHISADFCYSDLWNLAQSASEKNYMESQQHETSMLSHDVATVSPFLPGINMKGLSYLHHTPRFSWLR